MTSRYAWAQRGDINAFFGLILDNVAVMSLLLVMITSGDSAAGFSREFVFRQMIPGTVLGVVVGDLVYTWLAFRLARRTGRSDVTAMPLGLDTPSTFAVGGLILLPALEIRHGPEPFWLRSPAGDVLRLARRRGAAGDHRRREVDRRAAGRRGAEVGAARRAVGLAGGHCRGPDRVGAAMAEHRLAAAGWDGHAGLHSRDPRGASSVARSRAGRAGGGRLGRDHVLGVCQAWPGVARHPGAAPAGAHFACHLGTSGVSARVRARLAMVAAGACLRAAAVAGDAAVCLGDGRRRHRLHRERRGGRRRVRHPQHPLDRRHRVDPGRAVRAA